MLAGSALLAPTTAQAATASQAQPGGELAEFVLTIAEGELAFPMERKAVLGCQPPGGTHPSAAAACQELHQAQGNFQALPGSQEPAICYMIYAPRTVTATGVWHGEPVFYRATFPNDCVLYHLTGSVFQF